MEPHDLDPDPIRQFVTWFAEAEAAGVPVPEAMALATVAADGSPAARMVLLKGHGDDGFVFFTNRESAKGRELAANPRAALVFYWQPQHRQVRVEGTVEPVSDEESLAYFRTRPYGSRLAAWASPQSRPLESRVQLERRYAEASGRFAAGDVPLPPFWGGYRVLPHVIEFWQGRPDRLHDRVRYERAADGWRRVRLGP